MSSATGAGAGEMRAAGPSALRLRSCEVEQHFPTCVMSRMYDGVDDLNRRLAALLLRLETQARNVAAETSTVGGYQTDNALLSRNEPEIATLRQMIGTALEEYLPKLFQTECQAAPKGLKIDLWGWGVNMREGDVNTQHVHPGAKVSGVYYVATPQTATQVKTALKPEGAIIFADPRPRANMNRVPNQTTEITVPPQAGQMILFPSYYEHFVLPFRGPGVRSCVAFNASF
jgi:uncharacterized protein (TIGR02466 family)